MKLLEYARVVWYNADTMRGLHLEGVAMTYGARVLFRGVAAEVAPGEALVVTGANGAGKSTLLRIIAGLTRPDAGRTHYGGLLGYAAPDVSVYTELTGLENLAFFAGLRGLSPEQSALLAQVGLPRRRGDDLVGTYSSGMRQRLKLAVSLLGRPQMLVWDEPTLALDAAGGNRVEEILAGHRRGGGLAVLATNDAAEADRWADGGARIHLGHA